MIWLSNEEFRKILLVYLNRREILSIVSFYISDEETGGSMGMIPFVETQDFKSLNIGFALDEGYPSDDDVMFVSYQDKRPWRKLKNILSFYWYSKSGVSKLRPASLIRPVTTINPDSLKLVGSIWPAIDILFLRLVLIEIKLSAEKLNLFWPLNTKKPLWSKNSKFGDTCHSLIKC